MMSLNLFRRTPGYRAVASALLALFVAANASCYKFSGGGGFPSEIHSMYIESFENSTAQFELDQQLFRKLNEKLPRALGVRPAVEDKADAVVRGKISRYEDAAQNYRPGADTRSGVEVLAHQVQITISIMLVNKRTNTVLWESTALTGRGDYRPSTESDQVGREQALNNLVQQIIDGAQSQW
jgi:lipopolysaccharide assembly LptE-like protein